MQNPNLSNGQQCEAARRVRRRVRRRGGERGERRIRETNKSIRYINK
jgi:hypothetical protein